MTGLSNQVHPNLIESKNTPLQFQSSQNSPTTRLKLQIKKLPLRNLQTQSFS